MENTSKLIEIVSLGSVEAVQEYLSTERDIQGFIDINKKDHFLNSPILIAASRNDTKMVKLLIEIGANTNTTDFFGNTIKICKNV